MPTSALPVGNESDPLNLLPLFVFFACFVVNSGISDDSRRFAGEGLLDCRVGQTGLAIQKSMGDSTYLAKCDNRIARTDTRSAASNIAFQLRETPMEGFVTDRMVTLFGSR